MSIVIGLLAVAGYAIKCRYVRIRSEPTFWGERDR